MQNPTSNHPAISAFLQSRADALKPYAWAWHIRGTLNHFAGYVAQIGVMNFSAAMIQSGEGDVRAFATLMRRFYLATGGR